MPKRIDDCDTTSEYWDCECEGLYIHPYNHYTCVICNARRDDQPDSRVNEVLALGLRIKGDKNGKQA